MLRFMDFCLPLSGMGCVWADNRALTRRIGVSQTVAPGGCGPRSFVYVHAAPQRDTRGGAPRCMDRYP